MRAVTYAAYGAPDVLELVELPKPTPKAGEVLVRIRATSVTSGDARMRAFDIPTPVRIPARLVLGWSKPKNPVLGFELAGDVEAIGDGVTRFKPGDRVYGCKVYGNHAEYRVMAETDAIVKMPDDLDYAQAASLPFGALTALHFLRKGKLSAGKSLLIVGASGCVGAYGIQVAKHLGAIVTAVCSGANADFVRALGADRVIDYTKEDYLASGSYDAILETVGAKSFKDVKGVLERGGYFLNVVMNTPDVLALLSPFKDGRHIVGGTYDTTQDDLVELNRLVSAGAIAPVIDSRYTLEAIREAHARVDTKRKRGAVIVMV